MLGSGSYCCCFNGDCWGIGPGRSWDEDSFATGVERANTFEGVSAVVAEPKIEALPEAKRALGRLLCLLGRGRVLELLGLLEVALPGLAG